MNKSEKKKRLEQIIAQQDINRFQADLNRACSITVGTAFGGTTEVSMRGNGGQTLWCVMQPVEVIELIHQLAANAGCHIHVRPRDDFASWREWRVSDAEKKHLNGHPPFVNDMAVFQKLGASDFNQEEAERAVAHDLAQKEYAYVNGAAVKKSEIKQGGKNGKPMATKKTVNRRVAKPATKTS